MKNKNRKIVRKPFSYLQCDDFAAYLSDMAAKGWHFKEWGAGLVFEKGEPEQAVYAVEVFIHGSQYDLKPDDHTMNFSDYCEAAGWKLVDAKMKFCIFKQIRPDAVPIVTEQERLENATKAYRKQLIWQAVLAIIWIGNILMLFLPTRQFIKSILSNANLVIAAYWVFYCAYTIGRYIWYCAWKCKAKKRLYAGETAILSQADETLWNGIAIAAVGLFTIGYGITMGLWMVALFLGVLLAFMVLGFALNKLRPDANTYLGVQVLFSIVLTFVIIVVSASIASAENEKETDWREFPLVYEDLTDTVGELEDTFHTSSSSIFGSTHYYSLSYANDYLIYEIYETEHDWILDIIWDYQHSYARNAEPVDCTALWDAQSAYHNEVVEYYVRYDDAILFFRLDKNFILTEEHVSIICDALGLEG